MKIIRATDVRKNFQDVIDEVHYTKVPVIISKRERPWVIVQPLPEGDKELRKIIKAEEKGEKK